jgi:hypothetical protein
LWLITYFSGNAAGRLADTLPVASAVCNLIEGVVNVPLSFILIRIMREIVSGQDATRNHEVFA